MGAINTKTEKEILKDDATRSVVTYKDTPLTDAKVEKLCEALRKNRCAVAGGSVPCRAFVDVPRPPGSAQRLPNNPAACAGRPPRPGQGPFFCRATRLL